MNQRLLLLTLLSLSMLACGATQTRLTGNMKLGEKKGDASSLIKTGDDLWKDRADRKKAEAAVAKWEEAIQMDPTNAMAHLKLSYAYYFMANVHVKWEEDSDAKEEALFKKGYEVAEVAILLENPNFQKELKAEKSWEESISLVPKEKISSLYWYSTNLGKWSLKKGITTTLGNKNRIKSTMEHVRSLDETFFYGAPHRYFGVYEAKVPFGNIQESGKSFDKAIKINADYLDTQVLKAQYFAAKTQNEELFKTLLKAVIAADVTKIPELIVENKNAQRTAKDLLERIEDFF
jgi:tetratricopeptide (TPR) repeat protein